MLYEVITLTVVHKAVGEIKTKPKILTFFKTNIHLNLINSNTIFTPGFRRIGKRHFQAESLIRIRMKKSAGCLNPPYDMLFLYYYRC